MLLAQLASYHVAFHSLVYFRSIALHLFTSAQVYLQPTGLLSATGLAVQSFFLRTLLDKWKVKTTIIKREEYKNALNSVSETEFTPAHRQAVEELLGSVMSRIESDIAVSRGLSTEEVRVGKKHFASRAACSGSWVQLHVAWTHRPSASLHLI